jgi:uncharacterized Zn ribbon protein
LTLGCPRCATPMSRETDNIVYACPGCTDRWRPVMPESVAEGEWKVACGKQ